MDFPDPYADIPVPVTIKKIVEGETTSEAFSFRVDYQKLVNYENEILNADDKSNWLHI